MVNEPKDAGTRIISIKDQVFDTKAVYKALKEKIEKLGYDFIEKEHAKKDTKYGYEFKFKFSGFKEYDDFAKAEISIEAEFENLNKVKVNGEEIEKGDGSLKIKAAYLLDYKNYWGTSSIKQALFNAYTKYFIPGKIKKLYKVPTINDIDELSKTAKEKLEFYYKY